MARVIADPRTRADDAQVELLRRAGTARRSGLGLRLSASVIELSRQAIRRRHPDWSDADVLLEFARVHYGDTLADRIRARLATRRYP